MGIIQRLLHTPHIFDVRSPAEFDKGHIPGARNLPLFSNEERHEVGLCYKQQGKDKAVKLGLSFVGPKITRFVDQAEEWCPDRKLAMYCWRGGMRSGSMSHLLRFAGFEVDLVQGGYKTWRKAIRDRMATPLSLVNLSGYTGSGKTMVIEALRKAGEQVVNLEALANHRGSTFGHVGEQPTTEHFENLLGHALLQLDANRTIWIEDESRSIGRVYLSDDLYTQMQQAPLVIITKSKEQRTRELCEMYGQSSRQELIEAFERISKRMGGQHVKAAVEHLKNNDLESACAIALDYYDRTYSHGQKKRTATPAFSLDITGLCEEEIVDDLTTWKNQNSPNTATDPVAVAK